MIHSFRAYSLAEWIKIVIELSKIRISQLVAMSTAVGFVLATGKLTFTILPTIVGTFLLSCGAAALNQYQEWEADRLMNRTRYRPLPSGRLTPGEGLLISVLLLIAGTGVLLTGTNLPALLLGLLNVFWYNAVYTPLKRVTSFAVFPGSLIGAVPPAIGWVAGGRNLFEPQMMAIAIFFFIWQIPHFWLLLLNYSQDYERAGYPSLTSKFSLKQLARITFMWITGTAAACLFIPLYGIGTSLLLMLALFASAAYLLWSSRKLLGECVDRPVFNFAFRGVNVYILLVMFSLSMDRLINLSIL